MTIVKLALLAALLTSVCLVGCNGGDTQASVTPPPPGKSVANNGKNPTGAPVAGLNPNYHGSAASDDAKTGSALKGK